MTTTPQHSATDLIGPQDPARRRDQIRRELLVAQRALEVANEDVRIEAEFRQVPANVRRVDGTLAGRGHEAIQHYAEQAQRDVVRLAYLLECLEFETG